MSKKSKNHNQLILRAMVAIGAADGALRSVESIRICEIYQRLTDEEIGEEHVEQFAAERAMDETKLHEFLSGIRNELDRATKENILKASYLTLIADGAITAEEHKKLRDFARALRIEEVHFNAVMEDLADLT